MKKLIAMGLLIALASGLLSGCSAEQQGGTNPGESDVSSQETALTQEEIQAQKDFAKSTAKKDSNVGLKNIKIDTADANLTEEQKAVLKYFDNDYLTIPYMGYEYIRRYPKVFENAQMQLNGTIKKITAQTTESFEAILWVGIDSLSYSDIMNGYTEWYAEQMTDFVLIKGSTADVLFMEDDYIDVYGRYAGVETVDVDGTSYTIPVIETHTILMHDSYTEQAKKFDSKFIKTVAKAIFGEDIEIREPVCGEDYIDGAEDAIYYDPFYIVELENQSNAKFKKYRFYQCQGLIEDAKELFGYGSDNTPIQRVIEFSADFEHFFLFTYDTSMESLTLEYYDKALNKLWKREFEETSSAAYDYTKNNIYIVANNELYVINIATGEDTFAPTYIGSRLEIRKLSDGVVCISENKSDAVMKVNIDGVMIWKTNLSADVQEIYGIQVIEDRIVLQLYLEDGVHYVALSSETGEVLQDAISVQ